MGQVRPEAEIFVSEYAGQRGPALKRIRRHISMTTTTYNHADWYEAERLHRAANDGDVQEIERLISVGYDVNLFDDMSYTPLHHAVMGGSVDAVKALFRHGAFVDANDFANIGETPLALAVQSEYLELVCLLLESGADPDINGWMGLTARIRACSRADQTGKEMCKVLAAYLPKYYADSSMTGTSGWGRF